MMSPLVAFWLLAHVLCASSPAARAPVPNAPKDVEKQKKAVKEFAGKVVVAIAKQDIDGLVEMSEVPYYHGDVPYKGKAKLHGHLESSLEGKPVFEAKKYVVKSIETFKAAQATLLEIHTKQYKEVLSEDDFVVHVEVEYPKQTIQVRVLVKMKDGKPRLVGFGHETREPR